ncbi:MAG: exopolyphosphatase, partial [Longimicrobiales bacterium]
MIGLTGLDAEAKADLFCRQFWRACPWNPEDYEEVRTTLIGRGEEDPSSNAAAVSYLEIAVRDPDEEKVGRSWADTMVHIALGSIPGLFGVWPPRKASPYAVYWPTLIDRDAVTNVVHLGETSFDVPETEPGEPFTVTVEAPQLPSPHSGPLVRVPMGRVVGARSGDKGGSANLGVFTRTDDGYPWLAAFLTVQRLVELLPDLAVHEIERYELPRLRALNFVVHGILDQGVSSSLRFDAQAKGLAEYLRAKWIEVPEALTMLEDRDRADRAPGQ